MIDLTAIRALLASVAGFTPGPWRGDRNDGTIKYTVRGSDGRIVLTVDHKNGRYGFVVGDNYDEGHDIGGEHDADESLFLAAPDLHRELTEAVGEIERLREELGKPTVGPWRRELFGSQVRWHASAGEGDRIAAIARPPGDWRGGWIMRGFWGAPESSGPETEDAGRHAADLALIAAGYRLVGGVHPLPTEVPDAR